MDYLTEIFHCDAALPLFICKESSNAYMHNHDYMELDLILTPGGSYQIEGESYPIEQGDVFTIKEGEYHCIMGEASKTELLMLIFDREFLRSNDNTDELCFSILDKAASKHRLPVENVLPELLQLFQEIEMEWTKQETGYRVVIKALLIKLLGLLYRKLA